MKNASAITAAAVVIHFSCCRSTPRERRNRTISDHALATMHRVKHSSSTPRLATPTGSRASMAIGFCWPASDPSSSSPGETRSIAVRVTITPPLRRLNARHRRPGRRRPSGKRCSRNVDITPSAGAQIALLTVAPTAASGSEPGSITRPYVE